MADNVVVNSIPVATDEVGAVHYQRVKIAVGADDSVTDLKGDATGGAWVQGAVAHDGVDAAKPLKVGAKAVAGVAGQTPVAAADLTNLLAGLDGVLIVRQYCGLEDIVTGIDTDTDGASTAAIAAQGAGVRIYVTSVVVSNIDPDTDVTVDLRDGVSGAVLATLPAPYPGGTFNFPVPIPFSANTAVAVDPSAATDGVKTTVVGFRSKV